MGIYDWFEGKCALMSITSAQSSTLSGAYPSAEIYCSGAARLYSTSGGEWEYTGVCGGCVLILEADIYYIRIYSFTDSKTCFEQELYTGFSFVQPLSFFHHFEGTSCVYGLSFADDSDSGKFAENLAICVEDMGGSSQLYSGGGGSGGHHAAAAPPPMAHAPPVAAPMATPPPVAAPSQEYAPPTPPPSSSNDGPTSTPPMNTTPIQRSESPAQKRGKKEPTKKKGKFGFFRSKKQKKPAAEMVIGGPTDFKHESHIGWDMENGFDIRNIPPEWRKLFQAAGVKKSDLQDADTRKLIVSTINSNLGGDAPPPPAPNAPPPPPAPGGPPAPPPPAATGPPAVGGGLAAALAAKRDNLANAAQREESTPNISNISSQQGSSLADTLANVLSTRRAGIESAGGDDYGDEDDDWSDDWSD